MSLREPNPVLYFTAVMYDPKVISDPDKIVVEIFGETFVRSEEFDFDHTKYYEPEMGAGLRKYFISFDEFSDPALLASYKLKAIEAEGRYSKGGNRAINIDPGYLALEKVVVASTKNFTHRIYLRDGIFGDLQLMRQKSGYVPMAWTYADYIREESMDFFKKLAAKILEANKR